MDFDRCSRERSDPLISVEESRRAFTLRNDARETVREVRVDGCLIDDGERCDYLFELGEGCHCVIYLELKGADIEKAASQLRTTMARVAVRHRQATKVCHVVASRVPRAGPRIQVLKAEFVRKHGATLHVATTRAEVDIGKAPYRKP